MALAQCASLCSNPAEYSEGLLRTDSDRIKQLTRGYAGRCVPTRTGLNPSATHDLRGAQKWESFTAHQVSGAFDSREGAVRGGVWPQPTTRPPATRRNQDEFQLADPPVSSSRRLPSLRRSSPLDAGHRALAGRQIPPPHFPNYPDQTTRGTATCKQIALRRS